MKTILSILMLLFCIARADSQILSTWKGGTPGQEKNWNIPANWSTHNVPDEFTDVVIPLDITLRNNYPVINNGLSEIHTLWIHKGARLNITSKGNLSILSLEYSIFEMNQIIRDFHYSSEPSAITSLARMH